jgi:hypothetical protein
VQISDGYFDLFPPCSTKLRKVAIKNGSVETPLHSPEDDMLIGSSINTACVAIPLAA